VHQVIIRLQIVCIMKIPSTILKAMLITATVGVVATSTTGCKTRNVETENDKTFLEKVFKKNDGEQRAPDSCPACGMG
jgi:hypothetical protein